MLFCLIKEQDIDLFYSKGNLKWLLLWSSPIYNIKLNKLNLTFGGLPSEGEFALNSKNSCNAVDKYGKKEAGTGEHSTTLIIK